jgi:hypothetical protein
MAKSQEIVQRVSRETARTKKLTVWCFGLRTGMIDNTTIRRPFEVALWDHICTVGKLDRLKIIDPAAREEAIRIDICHYLKYYLSSSILHLRSASAYIQHMYRFVLYYLNESESSEIRSWSISKNAPVTNFQQRAQVPSRSRNCETTK